MKRQLQILLAGALLVIPFAITAWVIYKLGVTLGDAGEALLTEDYKKQFIDPDNPLIEAIPKIVGGALVLGLVYLVGLLTRLWVFRRLFGVIEGVFRRVPGVKTIYESVRDLLKLFGQDSSRMGRVVLYRPPGQSMTLLGIQTNDQPVPQAGGKVAVYLPMAYMIGGPVVLAEPDQLEEIDMPVETALKLCATGFVGECTPKTARPAEIGR